MLENFAEKYNAFLARRSVRRALFWLILAMGVFARVYFYGLVPIGLNQDEAFAGYEAWSLMNYGIDTAGYNNPVYLTAWGSGMNALETYLMMPFIAVLGLKPWVIRLPQLIVAMPEHMGDISSCAPDGERAGGAFRDVHARNLPVAYHDVPLGLESTSHRDFCSSGCTFSSRRWTIRVCCLCRR